MIRHWPIGLLLFVPLFFYPFLDIDEATFLIQVESWISGGTPYVSSWGDKMPGLYAVYLLGYGLSGFTHPWGVTLLNVISLAISAFCLSRLASPVAASWFLAAVASLEPKALAATGEGFVLAFTLTAMLIVSKRATAFRVVFSGVLMGLALLTRVQAVVLVIPLLLMVSGWRARGGFALGMCGIVGATCLVLMAVGAWPSFWQDAVLGGVTHVTTGWAGLPFQHWLERALVHVLLFLPLMVAMGWSWWKTKPESRAAATGFGLSWVATVPGWRAYSHYFMFVPAFAAMAIRFNKLPAALQLLFWIQLALALVMTVGRIDVDDLPARILGSDHPTARTEGLREVSDRVGRFVRAHSDDEDRIFVAGQQNQLYWYTDRQPWSWHAWSDRLVGRAAGTTLSQPSLDGESWQTLLDGLDSDPPRVIIDATAYQGYGSTFAAWPLAIWVSTNCTRQAKIAEFQIFVCEEAS